MRSKDLLAREYGNQPFDLKAAMVPTLFFPDTMPAFKAIEMFKSSRRHMALVIDEHGGGERLVTVNDILDALVPDIPSMDEQEEQSVVRREDGSFLPNGPMLIDQLKQTLQLRRLSGEEDGRFQTLGGFLMTRLGGVPAVANHIQVKGWRLEVVDMDRQRVDKVLATPIGNVTRIPTSG